jgi:hypothetical protein
MPIRLRLSLLMMSSQDDALGSQLLLRLLPDSSFLLFKQLYLFFMTGL